MRQPIKKPEVAFPLVTTSMMKEQVAMSSSSLRKWRTSGIITRNIHWQYAPGSEHAVLWNIKLMQSWLAHGSDQNHPEHKKLIEAYLKQIPCAA